jgi:hypothetical protein
MKKLSPREIIFVFVFLVVVFSSLYIINQLNTPSKNIGSSFGSLDSLLQQFNPAMPDSCIVTAEVGSPSDSQMLPKNCAGNNCFGDMNLIPLKIISSVDGDKKSSSSCSVLVNTVQYVEKYSNKVKMGQIINAEMIYTRREVRQNIYYLHKLTDIKIVND